MAFFYVLYLCHSKAPVLDHSNSGLFQSTLCNVPIVWQSISSKDTEHAKRHERKTSLLRCNFKKHHPGTTHTHTKPGNNNSFWIPRAKTFHQNLKREAKEMQHAKQETWKELLLLLFEGNFEKHTPGGHNKHTHTHTKVGKQQYNFFSLTRAKHPTDLLIDKYSPLLAPDTSTSLSVTGGLFVCLFVCLFAVRAIENKRQIILEIE